MARILNLFPWRRPIRAAVAEADPRLPVGSLTTLEDQIDRSLVVTRRTQGIGVRLALGAARSGAVWLIIGMHFSKSDRSVAL